jgi:hypothetical protein
MQIKYDLFPAQAFVCPPPTPEENEALNNDYTTLTVFSDRAIKHSRRVDAVRVVVYEDVVMIAADGQSGPMLIFKEGYDKSTLDLTTQRNKGVSRLVTTSGKIVVFSKDNNCGCGSKLRTWNPYNIMYSTKDPTE